MTKTTKHTFTTSLELFVNGDDRPEITVELDYTFYPGCPDYFDKAMGCWYPGDSKEVEVTALRLYRDKLQLDCPGWLADEIQDGISVETLVEHASEDQPE